MEGKLLLCRDCYKQFTFSVQDQIFYSSKRWDAPCRCPACRKIKKGRKYDPYEGWQTTMGSPCHARRGHRRVHYSGIIVAGGLSN